MLWVVYLEMIESSYSQHSFGSSWSVNSKTITSVRLPCPLARKRKSAPSETTTATVTNETSACSNLDRVLFQHKFQV